MTRPHFIQIIVTASLALFCWSNTTQAQSVVVGKFSDKTRRSVAKKARSAVARALSEKGADLVSASKYLKKARRMRIRKSRAFSSNGIRRVARRMGVEGVVLGKAVRSRGRYVHTLYLRGPNGKLWLKKIYTTRRRTFPAGKAEHFAELVMKHLGAGDSAPDRPDELALEEQDEVEEETYVPTQDVAGDDEGNLADDPDEVGDLGGALAGTFESQPSTKPELEEDMAPDSGAGDSRDGFGDSMPGINKESSGWGHQGQADSGANKNEKDEAQKAGKGMPSWAVADNSAPPAPKDDGYGRDDQAPEEVRAAPLVRRNKKSPVNDALVSVGLTIHQRSGLEPLHTTAAFPGIRFDGHLFLNTFTRSRYYRDLGLAFMVDTDLGLEYKYRGQDSTWKAEQTHWRIDLLYRLAMPQRYAPTLVFKTGAGGVTSTVDKSAEFAIDARYVGWRLGLDARWMLWKPMVRLIVSPTLLVSSAGGDLDATAWGMNFFCGIDLTLISMLHLGLGYDLNHYRFNDQASGSKDDTYHSFFLRVGYNYR